MTRDVATLRLEEGEVVHLLPYRYGETAACHCGGSLLWGSAAAVAGEVVAEWDLPIVLHQQPTCEAFDRLTFMDFLVYARTGAVPRHAPATTVAQRREKKNGR